MKMEQFQSLKKMKTEGINDLLSRVHLLVAERRKNKYLHYRPLPQQLPFHRSQAQTRAFIGGNRSGKTVAGIMESIWYAKGIHPYRSVLAPNKGWIVGLDTEVLKDTIIPQFFEYLPAKDVKRWNSKELVLELINGSLVKFKSCDSGAEKFQSAERRYIWFDEEPPYDIWHESRMRVGANYPLDTWLTMTPLQGLDWSYDELVLGQVPGVMEMFQGSMLGNTHLLKAERNRLKMEMEGKEDSAARMRGDYFARGGRIYKMLDEKVHYIDPFPIPANWPWIRCIDPHGNTPSAVVWAAIGPGNPSTLYFADEIGERESVLFSMLAEQIRSKDGKRRIIRSKIDPASITKDQRTGKSIKDTLGGLGVPTTLAKNALIPGWDAVRERLGGKAGARLFVFRTCPNVWRSLKNLSYDDWRLHSSEKDAKERQRKKDDHHADCVRYICMENLSHEQEDETRGVAEGPVESYTGYRG